MAGVARGCQPQLVPAFPTAEALGTLATGSFCVVLASWRRIATPHSSNTDFTVHAASYAPRAPLIKRVRIVDLDLPASQLLIDSSWNRLYFDQGFEWQPDDRSLTLDIAACECTASVCVVLPLPLDRVTSVALAPAFGPYAVRLTLAHRAPTPLVPIVAAFESLYEARCGVLQLVGVPGVGTLPLKAADVADVDAMSIVVRNPALAAFAVASAGAAPCSLFLHASAIPGPSALAALVSRAATAALASVCLDAYTGNGCSADALALPRQTPSGWSLYVHYGRTSDRFTLTLNFPPTGAGARVVIGGGVAAAMGFGSTHLIETPCHGVPVSAASSQCAARGMMFAPTSVGAVTVCAPSPRRALVGAYATVQEGNPGSPAELVARVDTALNRYSWPAFTFGIVLYRSTGTFSTLIHVAGGNMDVAGAVEAINYALGANADAFFIAAFAYNGGVAFESSTGVVFGIDWTVDPAFEPARVGYDRVLYRAATAHWPPHVALHVPHFGCAPPRSNVVATFHALDNRIVFTPTPFEPFAARVVAVLCTSVQPAQPTYRLDCAPYHHGLTVGASVALAATVGPDAIQQLGVVYDIINPTQFYVVRSDGTTSAALSINDAIRVVPLDAAPTTLYMQIGVVEGVPGAINNGSTSVNALPPDVLGLRAETYEVCHSLTAPGTLDVRQDPFVMVALNFQAVDGQPGTGDVYYPIPGAGGCTDCAAEGGGATVFAKVPRAVCQYRSEFERLFDHVFEGAGIHLNYIRVRILNPNFTPYQAHEHPVSLTLRFETRQSHCSLGEAMDAGSSGAAALAEAPVSMYSGQPLLPPPLPMPQQQQQQQQTPF